MKTTMNRINPGQDALLVVDESGRVVAATHDPDEVQYTADHDRLHRWEFLVDIKPEAEELPSLRHNPVWDGTEPEQALRVSGLRPLSQEEVLDMPLTEAYRRIKPFFQLVRKHTPKVDKKGKAKKTRGIIELKNIVAPIDGLLSMNSKLAKVFPDGSPMPPTVSLGLALVPEESAFTGRSEAGAHFSEMPVASRFMGEQVSRYPTLCYGSSRECRSSCLLYAGKNQGDQHNNVAKMGKTLALLAEPVAFMRVFLTALNLYQKNRTKKELKEALVRLVRFNVLSDIPLEVLAPWLIHAQQLRAAGGVPMRGKTPKHEDINLAGLRFYDYTKVQGRQHLDRSRYDLTFSYSGTNAHKCDAVLRGDPALGIDPGRVAMVFLAPKDEDKRVSIGYVPKVTTSAAADKALTAAGRRRKGSRGYVPPAIYETDAKGRRKLVYKSPEQEEAELMYYYARNPLPRVVSDPLLLGGQQIPVIDGDKTDFRIYDELRTVIGLRWKVPQTIDATEEEKAMRAVPRRFVVRGRVIDSDVGYVFAMPETPLYRPEYDTPQSTLPV